MIVIKDINGKIILAYDGPLLYYNTSEEDEEEFEIDGLNSIRIEYLDINDSGGLKLYTLLEYQKELGVFTDIEQVVQSIKENIPYLSRLLDDYYSSIAALNKRIVLLEVEGSGPASSWSTILYLIDETGHFTLESSRKRNESASEIVEYYGLGNNEYWNQIQANGEFVQQQISNIKSGEDLFNGIIEILANEEHWNIKEENIKWQLIINNLVANSSTHKIGLELKNICSV